MDFKMNPDHEIEFNIKCRPVFLKDGKEDRNAKGMIKSMVEKFFDAGCVKHFQNYIIPSLDTWIQEHDKTFLLEQQENPPVPLVEPVVPSLLDDGQINANEERKSSAVDLEDIALGQDE